MTHSTDPAVIERAAEAICALHEDLTRTPWSEWADIVKDCYRADARAALRAAESPSVAEAVEREPCQICQDILLIEESRQAGDSTPGGFEHMGDVWRQITEWAAAIRNRKE